MPDDAEQSATPPLKRHPALQPLSREHMSGLIQARALRNAAAEDPPARRAAIDAFSAVWRDEISDHFDDEERLLLPLTDDPSLADRLLAEHAVLRDLAARCLDDPDALAAEPETLERLGTLLHDHIRWEERVYFERIQQDHPGVLEAMHTEADDIERRRPGARPRIPDARKRAGTPASPSRPGESP